MPTNYGQTGSSASYAGFWLRVAAYIIDSALLMILSLAIILGAASLDEMLAVLASLAVLLINLLYWPVMESSVRQATFGKSIVGIKVSNLQGGRLTFWRALLRNLAKILSAIPLSIGFLLAGFTARKQALHDMITHNIVVRTEPAQYVKAFGVALLALVIAGGGGGAYFYAVLMPQMQAEFGEELQAALNPGVNPLTAQLQTAVAAAHIQPDSAKPLPAVVPAIAPVIEPVIEPVKPAAQLVPAAAVEMAKPEVVAVIQPKLIATPVVSQPDQQQIKVPPKVGVVQVKTKKPVNKPLSDNMHRPAPEKFVAPAPAVMTQEVLPSMPETLLKPAPFVTYAPDTQPRVIQPKYNDLVTAVLRDDSAAVKQLLELGWWVDKPGTSGTTPLLAAVRSENLKMVLLLLDHGALPSSQALALAKAKKHTEIAMLLEQRGAR